LQANLKVKILSKWPVITMCISLATHHTFKGDGYLANWQNPFCQILSQQQQFTYTITANTNGTGFYSFLVSFYGAEKNLKMIITYRPTYMDFYWLYPCTLSSVSSELTKLSFLPNTVTTATLHLHTKTANTNGTVF